VCIPQSLVPDISSVNVKLNGTTITHTSVLKDNVWLITFTYHHSSHTVVIALGSNTAPASTVPQFPYIAALSLLIVATLGIAVALNAKKIYRKTKQFSKE
jgi:hypothetical protein